MPCCGLMCCSTAPVRVLLGDFDFLLGENGRSIVDVLVSFAGVENLLIFRQSKLSTLLLGLSCSIDCSFSEAEDDEAPLSCALVLTSSIEFSSVNLGFLEAFLPLVLPLLSLPFLAGGLVPVILETAAAILSGDK